MLGLAEQIFIAATNNHKKLSELCEMLSELGISVSAKNDAGIEINPEENGESFEENAYIKARAVCIASGMPAIADDSGLCVDALNGAPGIYSARFGGEGLNDKQRTQYLLEKMKSVPNGKRTARFVCVICAVFPNGDTLKAHGVCRGEILQKPEGDYGFGYDPIFRGETGISFGRLHAGEKNKISHRAKALALFKENLIQYNKQNNLYR